MGPTLDELRTDAEDRRAHLAHSVDALAERMTPRRVVRRKAGAVRHRVSGVKDRVMGTAQATTHGASESLGQATGNITETAKEVGGRVGETVQQAPAQMKRHTQGSPLAAGLIAFGSGMLTAALLPTTETEERAGRQLREHSEGLLEPVKQTVAETAQEVKEEMREPAAQAVEAVKSTAQDAGEIAKDHAHNAGQATAQGLRQVGQDAAEQVRRTPGTSGSA